VPRPYFHVRRSGIQGRGAFALRAIRKGTRIVEYVGERLTDEEVDRRYSGWDGKRDHTFLFEVSKRVCIDASRRGNAARYVNHSCEPNCEAVQEGDRIFIEALVDIPKGAELTYDYSLEPADVPKRAWKRAYGCRCGAAKCRGTMVDARLTRPKRRRKPKTGGRKSTGRRSTRP
jgi:SET domain-containing protein